MHQFKHESRSIKCVDPLHFLLNKNRNPSLLMCWYKQKLSNLKSLSLTEPRPQQGEADQQRSPRTKWNCLKAHRGAQGTFETLGAYTLWLMFMFMTPPAGEQ